ncbi:hypothetical protein [Pseudoxanthomonas winnipegensis]|uniref:hypothetical protein n=1 Tax=Pseudoxanthomonas winnipegensis TaxID=2480810 RepID=UPI00102D9A81|nr:hypothetical protein [Pseudoxanthomonas winnipegensis]TAA08845.1 hypothetical protein EA659_13420 [Pseudoxanthomonas winnipegensis]TAH71801.1 hypothetical protein EA657_11805 [Pseudoxanthomonas winnipegensis]
MALSLLKRPPFWVLVVKHFLLPPFCIALVLAPVAAWVFLGYWVASAYGIDAGLFAMGGVVAFLVLSYRAWCSALDEVERRDRREGRV